MTKTRSKPKQELKQSITSAIERTVRVFVQNVQALREFVDAVRPTLENPKKTDDERRADALLQLIAFHVASKKPKWSDKKIASLERQCGGKVEIAGQENGKPSLKISGVSLSIVRKMETSSRKRDEQNALLYRSALMSLTSMCEVLVADLIRVHCKQFPHSLGATDVSIGLGDLLKCDNVEDAIEHVIESRVETLLYGSVSDWIEYFRHRIKLKCPYLDEVEERLVEVFQRRNLIVHNGGLMSRRYKAKVKSTVQCDVLIGRLVPVDQQYLDDAITLIETSFALLGFAYWAHLSREGKALGSLVVDVAFTHMEAERWGVGEVFYGWAKDQQELTASDRTISLINYWQAMKWQDQIAKVADEIRNADFSDREPAFELCRLVLLDDFKGAGQLVAKCAKVGRPDASAFQHWPIFRNARKSRTFMRAVREQFPRSK